MRKLIYDHDSVSLGGGAVPVANEITDILKEAEQSDAQLQETTAVTPKLAIGTEQPKGIDTDNPAGSPEPGNTPDGSTPKSTLFGDSFFSAKPKGTHTEQSNSNNTYAPFPGATDTPNTPPSGSTAKTKSGVSMDVFLKVRNQLQARLCAMLAKTDNVDKYKLDESELDLLAEVYAPYADSITGELPPWVMIIAVEAITTGNKLVMAINDRKVNIRNEKERNRVVNSNVPSMANAVAKTVPFPTGNVSMKGERTRFEINSDGFYQNSRLIPGRSTRYLKKDEATEPVDLKNLEHVKHVVLKNGGRKKVGRILNLPMEWFEQRGITSDNPTLKDD